MSTMVDEPSECRLCGGSFIPRRAGKPQTHCSRECKQQADNRARRERAAAKRTARPSTCPECGTAFEQPVIGRSKVYCSVQCKRRVLNRAQNRRRNYSVPLADRTCLGCPATFTPKRKDQQYCTSRCMVNARQRRRYRKEPLRQGVDFRQTCVECGAEFVAKKANAKWCSASCRIRTQARDSSRRRGDPTTEDMPYVDRVIFERDGWICHLCKGKVDQARPRTDPLGATIDHIVPRSEGGADSPANVATAHLKCNLAKGIKPMNEQLRLI